MKKLLVMMLVVTMSVTMLAGCNTNANGEATGQNTEAESVVDSEEIVSEEVSELTLEEKIAAEMPAKLEVGEDEIIVPETVTAEQIMAKWEEIKVTEGEYAEDINKENLAGLLVLNCSYMEPAEFNSLVNEHFGSVDELMVSYDNYRSYLLNNGIYGENCSSVMPEDLFFDEYLINQAEQLHCFIKMYQTDSENSKEYYDIIMNYLLYNENNLFTLDSNDERLQGSGLASLQDIILLPIRDDIIEYDIDLYLENNVFVAAHTNIRNIVEEHANQ